MSLSTHYMQLPREILIGCDVIEKVADVCKRLGLHSSALVLSGPITYDIAAKKVIDILESNGFETIFFKVNDSNIINVDLAKRLVDETNPEVIFGVGGGKVIDVGKLTASSKMTSFISIPTAASHDGIASSRVSIKDYGKHVSINTQAPVAIIADTRIISGSPYKLTASGCGDIIAKYTAVRDWKLAHDINGEYYGEYAASLALMGANLVVKNADLIHKKDDRGIRIVLEALISCGVAMSITGSSRPCSGSEHLVSHALDSILPNSALHGEQCGIATIMMAKLHGLDWRMIKDKLEIIGAPTTAKELGILPKQIINALVQAKFVRAKRYTILNDLLLTRSKAEKLARETGIIY